VKWIIFAIAVAGVLPLAQWLRRNPHLTAKAWILFGFLPFAYNPHIALIDWAGWPGYVQGILATGLDLLALTLFINLPKAKRPAPFRIVMGLYFIAMVVSIFQSDVPMASMFYPWQLLKVYFVYIVVRRASSDEHVLDAILTGMTIALCFEVVMAGWQRMGHDVARAAGSFGDKNLLGFVTEFAILTPFALLLAGRRSWQTTVAPIAGMLIAILTASRAAIGFSTIGLVLVFLGSSLRKWTPKKASVLFKGVIVFSLLAPFAWYSLQERYAQEPIPAADERVLFNRAAEMILSDHPFGVGTNNYVIIANSGGYSERAGVPWTSSVAIVHSVYWLTAAETGYFGLIALVLLWVRINFVSLRCGWKYTDDVRGDMLLGLGVTLVIVALHNAYEWVFLVYSVQYLFGITAGLVAGLSEQLGYWGTPQQVAHRRSFLHDRSLRTPSAIDPV
jgi:hypothetical protein